MLFLLFESVMPRARGIFFYGHLTSFFTSFSPVHSSPVIPNVFLPSFRTNVRNLKAEISRRLAPRNDNRGRDEMTIGGGERTVLSSRTFRLVIPNVFLSSFRTNVRNLKAEISRFARNDRKGLGEMTIGGGERTVLSSRAIASGSRPFSTTGGICSPTLTLRLEMTVCRGRQGQCGRGAPAFFFRHSERFPPVIPNECEESQGRDFSLRLEMTVCRVQREYYRKGAPRENGAGVTKHEKAGRTAGENGSNDSKRRGKKRAKTVQNDRKSCAKSRKNTKKTAGKAVGKNKLSQKVYFLRERKSGGNFVLPARF